MNRKFGNLRAIFFSLYKKELYQDVKANWSGIGVGYIFVVLLIASLCQSFLVFNYVHPVEKSLVEAWKQVPEITVTKGIAKSNNNEKVVIKSNWGEQLIEVNTSSSVPDLQNSKATVFITKTSVISRDKDGEVTRTAYPSSEKVINFNPGNIKPKFSHSLSYFPVIILYPFMVLVGFIVTFIVGVFFSLVLKVIALILSAPISCGQAMRLAFVAMTPGFIFSIVLILLRTTLNHMTLFTLLLTVIYLVYAVWCNRTRGAC